MNTLLDPAQQQQDQQDLHSRTTDREISLGTGTILTIFFALAALCAVFFGFGYTLGAKRPSPAPIVAAAPSPPSNFSAFKPPPGSPLPTSKPVETVTVPLSATAESPTDSAVPITRPAVPAVAVATPSPTQFIVQVAAVSHQEDADLIASTLKRRAYPVAIRREPQDTLLHLQLGPYPTKKDAEAMRQRLLADGFNAYIK